MNEIELKKEKVKLEETLEIIQEVLGVEKENLKKMQWEDIQKIGENINRFTNNALARKRAFGYPNESIEKYKKI